MNGAPAASRAARSFATSPFTSASTSRVSAASSVVAISTSRRCVAVGICRVSHVLIPEEKFDEIKRVFESKASVVSRCYVNGIEAGEIDKSAKGHVTVGVTVTTSGAASDVKILESDLGSQAIEGCIRDLVTTWTFTDALPKPVETSHTYVLDRF